MAPKHADTDWTRACHLFAQEPFDILCKRWAGFQQLFQDPRARLINFLNLITVLSKNRTNCERAAQLWTYTSPSMNADRALEFVSAVELHADLTSDMINFIRGLILRTWCKSYDDSGLEIWQSSLSHPHLPRPFAAIPTESGPHHFVFAPPEHARNTPLNTSLEFFNSMQKLIETFPKRNLHFSVFLPIIEILGLRPLAIHPQASLTLLQDIVNGWDHGPMKAVMSVNFQRPHQEPTVLLNWIHSHVMRTACSQRTLLDLHQLHLGLPKWHAHFWPPQKELLERAAVDLIQDYERGRKGTAEWNKERLHVFSLIKNCEKDLSKSRRNQLQIVSTALLLDLFQLLNRTEKFAYLVDRLQTRDIPPTEIPVYLNVLMTGVESRLINEGIWILKIIQLLNPILRLDVQYINDLYALGYREKQFDLRQATEGLLYLTHRPNEATRALIDHTLDALWRAGSSDEDGREILEHATANLIHVCQTSRKPYLLPLALVIMDIWVSHLATHHEKSCILAMEALTHLLTYLPNIWKIGQDEPRALKSIRQQLNTRHLLDPMSKESRLKILSNWPLLRERAPSAKGSKLTQNTTTDLRNKNDHPYPSEQL